MIKIMCCFCMFGFVCISCFCLFFCNIEITISARQDIQQIKIGMFVSNARTAAGICIGR